MTKLFSIFFLLLTLKTFGQQVGNTDVSKQKIDKICDTFMQQIVESKFLDAFELLKQYTAIPSSTIDNLQGKTKEQFNILPYGKLLSFEFIVESKIKDFVAKRFYIVKFEKFYLKFDFTLYYNGKSWTITSFKYNEDINELLH